jgi:DNA polymerase V
MLTTIAQVYLPDVSTSCPRPLFLVPVSAGFPSPADDYLEGKLDLNRHLIKHERPPSLSASLAIR